MIMTALVVSIVSLVDAGFILHLSPRLLPQHPDQESNPELSR